MSNLSVTESISAGLNPAQLEAVKHFEGPILVLAGAGSGKTRVLTKRIASLVLERGVSPDSILAVTFTNKATEEMRSRLSALLGADSDRLWVATFHSAALRMLRRHAQRIGYTNDFVVYDDDDTLSTMKDILGELNIDPKKYPPQHFLRCLDYAKNNFISPEKFKGRSLDKVLAQYEVQVYAEYQKALVRANAMDFGDLLVGAVRLMERPDVSALYRSTVKFILVDEYQDTNHVQYLFLRHLSTPLHNILVVGDDDQSIYGFRGANIRNILEFERDYPKARVVKLEQNYRSTANILALAQAVIEKNSNRTGKKIWTDSGAGAPVRTYVATDELDEAAFIAREIQTLKRRGTKLDDMALFYRMNAQSRALEEGLIRAGIPYRIFGGQRFYERREIKDLIAYLRLIVNPADDQAFLRAVSNPPRGVGPQAIAGLSAYAKESGLALLPAAQKALLEGRTKGKGLGIFVHLIEEFTASASSLVLDVLVENILIKSGYKAHLEASKDPQVQARLENIEELKAVARSVYEANKPALEIVRSFLDRVALASSADKPKDEGSSEGAVSLMTLHLAKGLEFPVVFLTGLEEGLLPHYRSLEDPTGLEEERRLCYVGITRAMSELYVTRATQRGMFSAGGGFGVSGMQRQVSRFATCFPEDRLYHLSDRFLSSGYGGLREDNEDDEDECLTWGSKASRRTFVSAPNNKSGFSTKSSRARSGQSSGLLRYAETLGGARTHQDLEIQGIARQVALKGKKAGNKAKLDHLPIASEESLYPGVKVAHAMFGEGVVVEVSCETGEGSDAQSSANSNKDLEIQVDFGGRSRKLLLKYAKLHLVPS